MSNPHVNMVFKKMATVELIKLTFMVSSIKLHSISLIMTTSDDSHH